MPDILASCRIMRCMLRTPGLSGLKAMLRDGRLSQEDVACLSDIHEAFADLGALVAVSCSAGVKGQPTIQVDPVPRDEREVAGYALSALPP